MPAKPGVILVAEDDSRLATFISRNLEARGFRVVAASNGLEALALFEHEDVALLILDIMMPRLDGLEVCRRVRERSTVPIIVLTALDEQSDRVRALDMGADDFIGKPFGVEELLARVRAVLRRSGWSETPPPADVLRFEELEIWPAERRVRVQAADVRLTPTEFELLRTLAQGAGKVFTHRDLLVRVWGPEYADEVEYVRVYMNRLRQKLERNPTKPRHLVTELGVGYRFVR